MTTTTIARNTFLEIITSPLLVILALLGLVAVVLLGIIPYFTLVLEDDVKMYKDVAVAMTLFIALLLAVLSASKVIDEEIDSKTMMTLLSKPVLRAARANMSANTCIWKNLKTLPKGLMSALL